MKQKKLIGPCQLTRLKIFIDFKERSESIRTYGSSKTIFLDHMDGNDIGKLLNHAGHKRNYEKLTPLEDHKMFLKYPQVP